jgi:hypothetical protein
VKIVFEFDDLNPHPEVDCLPIIKQLVDRYPSIKLTFFTPAAYKDCYLISNPSWCDEIRKLIESNNICLTVHGLTHYQEEFKFLSFEEANHRLAIAEKLFKEAELPFFKIFRGPHWGINEATYKALISRGYSSCWNHESYRSLAEKFPEMRTIYYSWNLKDNFEESGQENSELIIAHGHTLNVCGNGIEESFNRICEMIDQYQPEFLFASEV